MPKSEIELKMEEYGKRKSKYYDKARYTDKGKPTIGLSAGEVSRLLKVDVTKIPIMSNFSDYDFFKENPEIHYVYRNKGKFYVFWELPNVIVEKFSKEKNIEYTSMEQFAFLNDDIVRFSDGVRLADCELIYKREECQKK